MASTMSLTANARPFVGGKAAQSVRLGEKVCRASNRPTWLVNAPPPSYLDGSLPGDYGYDPLGLASDEDRRAWYVEAEKLNGRWAMNGVVGILVTELLGVQEKWFEIDAKDFFLPLNAMIAFQAVIMGYFEMKRYRGWAETGQSGAVDSFPWDPLGYNSPDNAVKEVKNGRLAMFAFTGFIAQAVVVRKGPIACLTDHLQDPFGSNILTNVLKLKEVGTYPAGAVGQAVQAVTEAVQ